MSDQQPEPQEQPQLPPLIAEPATVQACQQDYADAADVRARLGWTDS